MVPVVHYVQQHATCVRRYRDYEVEAEAEAARRVQQAAEAGQDRSAGTAPEQQPSLVPLGLEGGCRCAHRPACRPRAALSATAGPHYSDRQVSDDWKPTFYDSIVCLAHAGHSITSWGWHEGG